MYKIRIHILALLMFAFGQTQAGAELRVVTSIKPVHSLVAFIMQGAGKPRLILDGQGTPHGYTLRPSKAGLLAKADIIFWIGPELETFLKRPVKNIAVAAISVELSNAAGLRKLHTRAFNDDVTATGTMNHDHDGHGTIDPHIWLDPRNAKEMAKTIAAELIKADPANAEKYQKNIEALMRKLDELQDQTQILLEPVKNLAFMTYHDGYQYFETRFGLHSKGVVVANPDILPGARGIMSIRNKLNKLGKICLFTELQFPQKIVNTVSENTGAKIAILDPLGTKILPGPDLYFELIEIMANSFQNCLVSVAE